MSDHFQACTSGPCQQGRKPCPSPQACRLSESDADAVWRRRVATRALVLALAAALIGYVLLTAMPLR